MPITRKEKIAIIGAGPAGLTAAHDLALRGYRVEVFEELPKPGGMMRYGIPAYRLSRTVIDQEIADIAALGVTIRTGVRVGREVRFEDILGSYDRLILATGAHCTIPLRIPGEELQGVIGAVEFLRAVNLDCPPTLGTRVAVIGGGNTAIDVARTAVRLGAREVRILYRRQRSDMPAWEHEIKAALAEGIVLDCMVAPVRCEGTAGKLTRIVCQRLQSGEFDRSGRRRSVPIPGSEFALPVDTVICAVSQTSDLSFVPNSAGIKASPDGTIICSPRNSAHTSCARVYAAGDAVLGPATVVEAIAAGHRAAREVDEDIRQINHEPPWQEPAQVPIDIPFEVDEETVSRPRVAMPELRVQERTGSFQEVERGYDSESAWLEACRCQRCDGNRNDINHP
ncbi:MAG: FAD-dependent oxidoreductase [Desulfobacterota bacterium]|nr:FAD-dependent oxidoreductase [Thermodesulfobacteriota bacterium]